jgi:hypothetical protein
VTEPDRSADREPLRAAVAIALSIAVVVLVWNIKLGAAALLLTPVLAAWVVTVYLGAPLTGRVQLERLRQLRP